MLAADLWQSIPDQTLSSATLHIGLSDHFRETQSFSDSVVRFETNAPLANQDFFVRLYDSSTPITVDNFLTYVADGSYDRSIIHRTVDNFVIQGGGYRTPTLPADQAGSDPTAVPARPAIANEPGNANTRGTIAMAKLSGQPHSATNQWFINLRDNASLNTDNGGYTVFGEVLGGGMSVVDAIASALEYDATTYYGNGALRELPLWNVNSDNIIRPEDFVTIESVTQVNSSALLDYSVSSSRPSLATAWIDDGRLIVAQAPGASGAVEITVTARSILDGSSVSDSFVIHIAAAPLGDLPLPRMLGDLNPLGSSNPMNFAESGDFVYFTTELPEQGPDGSPKAGLWRTQGTASTTVQVGAVDGQVRSLVTIPGGRVAALVETLSFSDNRDSAHPWTVTGVDVWEVGSEPRLLSSLAPQAPQGEVLMGGQSLEYVNDRLLVFGTVREASAPEWQTAYTGLWSINPGSGASTFVTSFHQASPQRFWYSQGSITHGSFLYFFADEGDGFGLYRTDGTMGGTRRIRSEPDVYTLLPGILGMHAEFAVLNETIVYATTVSDPVTGVQVGAIAVFDPTNPDPTYTGSVLTNIDRGVRPSHLTVIGDDLYFLASDSGHWDYVLNEFMPGEGVVYAFDSTTDTLSPVFSTTGITAEDAQIFALSSIGDALVVGAGTMGSGQDGEPHGEIWSIRRRETSPPTLALIGSTVGEDAPLGTRVGEFQITGSFPGESFSFGFAQGEGDDGNTSFTIFDNALLTGSILDFEAQATYSIRVRAEGDLGTSTEQVLTVVIDDVYEGEMQFVRIGNPGNSADPRTGSLYGDVSYEYEIGAFEITLGEYSDFLNAAAASDPYGLYHEAMATNPSVAGIQRFGSPGSYWYQVMAPAGDLSAGSQTAANRPVTYVSWYDAARFANWMHNGQGDGSTETGAYELAGMTGGGAIARNADARFSLPTEDEWYKAAYYSPDLNSGAGGYHIYATQSDTPPGSQIGSSPNQANFFTGRHATTPATSLTYQPNQNYLTDVGAFPGSSSFYGTFDQTGNVWEWNDLDGFDGPQRGFMGGMWNSTAVHQRSDSRWVEGTWNERDNLGFRLVKLDPVDRDNEPPTDIAISGLSIAETQPSGTMIGTFSTADPDASDTFIYALVPGYGSTDNASFTISGNELRTAVSFDFTAESSYAVRVRSTDQSGLFVEKTFTLTVAAAGGPLSVDLTLDSQPEDMIRARLGTLSVNEPLTASKHTFSLVSGAGSDHNHLFSINGNNLFISSWAVEPNTMYSIRVRVADDRGRFAETVVPLTIPASPPAALSRAVSLGDIVAGRDGFGNSTTGLGEVDGIDPSTGLFEISPNIGHVYDAGFRSVADASAIDGVFILKGNSGPTQINSAGVMYTPLPTDGQGVAFDHVTHSREPGNNAPITLEGVTFASGIGIHGSAGITFDLRDIAESNGRPDRFTAHFGKMNGIGAVRGYVVFSDEAGVITEHVTRVVNDSTEPPEFIDLLIPADATSLTLITGAVGPITNDHAVFGAPTISVQQTNVRPSSIVLSNASVFEHQPIGTVVGTLSANDSDGGNAFNYALVGGDGSVDNAFFTITDNQLRTAARFDIEAKSSYAIRIRCTEPGGLFTDRAFTINVIRSAHSPGYRAERLIGVPHELFIEDGLFMAVDGAVAFTTFDSSELYLVRSDLSTGELTADAAPAPWKSGFGELLTTIERTGNTRLQKDGDGRLYVAGRPVIANGRHVTATSFAGYSPLAAETIGGTNKLLWQNQTTRQLLPWQLDANWNRISSEPPIDFPEPGDPTLAWPPIVSPAFRQIELDFGSDLNADGMIGDFHRYQHGSGTASPALYVAGGLGQVFFAQRSLGYGMEPWALPLVAAPGDRFEPNNSERDAVLLSKREGLGTITGLSLHSWDDTDVFTLEITDTATSDHFVKLVAHNMSGAGAFMDVRRLDAATGLTHQVGTTPHVTNGGASIPLTNMPAGTYFIFVNGDAVQATGDYDLEWSLPSRTVAADDFEPNDSRAEAAELVFAEANGAVAGLSLHSAIDTDWFRFQFNAPPLPGDSLRLRSDGDIQASLFYAADDVPVRSTDLYWQNGVIQLGNLSPGEYFLEIQSFSGEVLEYELSWDITPPPVSDLPLPRLLADLSPNGDSWPKMFTEVGDLVYFVTSVQDGDTVLQSTLWSADGTSAAPSSIATFQGEIAALAAKDDHTLVILINTYATEQLSNTLSQHRTFRGLEIWTSDGTSTGTHRRDVLYGDNNQLITRATAPIFRTVRGRLLAQINIETDEGVLSDLWHIDAAPTDAALPGETTDSAFMYWNGVAPPDAYVRRLPYEQGGQDKIWLFTQSSPGLRVGTMASVGISRDHDPTMIQRTSDSDGDGSAEVLLIDRELYFRFVEGLPVFSESNFIWTYEDGTQAAMPGGTKALNGRPFDTGITAVSEVRDALTAFVSSAASAASTRLVSSTSAQSAPSILSSEKAFDAQGFYFVQADGGTDSNFELNLYRTDGTPLGTEVIAQLGVPGPITLEGFADTFDIIVKGETILMAVLQSQSDAIDGAQSLVGNINVFTHDLLTHQTSTVMRGLQTRIPDSVEFSLSENNVLLKTHEAIYRIDSPPNVLDHFQAITLATHESETILDATILGDYVYYVTISHSAGAAASQILSLWRGYLDNRMAPERLMSHSAMTGSFFGDWPKIDLIAADNKLVFAFDESLWLLKDADLTSPVAVNRIAAPWRGDLVGMPPADATDWYPPLEVTPALGSIFFGVGSDAYGVEPWILPLAATAGDPFEPNNSPEAAWNFGPLESSGMESATIHDANDVDFYRFQTTAAGGGDHRIAISLTDSAEGDLDLELYRYVGSELQFISRAATSNSIESIPFKGLSTGDYLLKVFPHDKRANGYDLHWHLPTSTTLTPDAYEPNDTEASAFPIQITGGSFHEPLLSLHSENDVDHFRITLAATGAPDSYVQVTSDANIDVWIKDVLGDPALSMFSYFDQSNTVWGDGKISLSGIPAGEYIIGVASFAIPSDVATYGLSVHLPTPLDPSVPPDWAEPNNSQGTAFNLLTIAGQGGRDGLTLHSVPPGQSGDVDVYRFDLLPNAMVGHTIDVLFTHLQGDIDAQILDSAGNLVRRGNSLSNDETLSLAGLLPGSYFLKVFGKEGPTGESRVANTYALRWNAPLGGSTFTPDVFEPNDTRSDAHDFRVVEGSFTTPSLTVHSAEDRDWYRFEITASAEARHAVEVLFSDAIGNLDARLYNSQGRRLATAATTDDNEKLSLGGLSAGVYFVEVYASANSGGGPNTYRLRLNTPSASGDHYEVNDSADQATWLGPVARGTVLEDLSIHTATDSDFFRFELTTAGTWRDEIVVQFQHALGDLDVELSDADGNSVGYGASVSNDEAISLQGLPPGTYILEVYGFGGASNDYRIEWHTPAATVVPPDPYEPVHLDPDQPETCNDAYWLGLLEGFGEFPSLSAIPFPGAIDDAVLPTIHSANDRDFWRFQTATLSGDEHAIRIVFESLAGDLDLRLHRSTAPASFDAFGNWVPEQWEVVAEADSINDIEVIHLAGLLPGDYCLEVYGFDGATNAYSINWDLPSYSIAPDRFEPNDLTATSLRELSGIFFEPELTIHSAADIDRYLVSLRAPGTFADFISVVNQDGWSGNDLFVEITPVGGGHAAATTMQWGFDSHLSLEGLPAGDYELTVSAAPWAAEFTGSTYEIHGYLSPVVDALDRDRFEANETAQHATQLRSITTETFDDLTIHTATDVDYFFFTLDAAASPTDSISVDFRHRDGDLDVELLSIGASGEEVLRGGYSTADNEFLELSGLPAGEYFLKVYGYAGATNEYSLRFDVQPTSVRADRLEPNNDLAMAHRLRTVTGFHSVETLTVHTPDDEDWFGFQTIGIGNASHFIAVASHGGGMSVDLFHSDGRPVRMDADDAFRDGFVSLNQLPAGQYFARVTGIDGHVGGYDLFLDAPSIADPPTGGGPADTADWTIMVYVTASNLFEYAFADINEMEKAVSELPGSVNITVFWDQSSAGLTYPTGGGSQPAWGGAGQAIITADTNMASVRTSFDLLGEQNSGDPATLQRFVQWSTDSAPAENYALILWDHGAGLEGFNFDDTDGTATDHLTTEELVSALTSFSDGPASLDLVAFDACLMASAEVGYALRNVTDVFVASQENVGGDGYDYTTLLNRLQTSSPRDVSAEQLAAGFVRSFGEHYVGTGNWDTHSAIRTAGYDALASTLREFSSTLQAAEMPVKRAVASAIGFAHTFNFDYLRDLGAFMARVSGHGGVSSVVQNAASAVSQALGDLIVAKTSDSRQSSGLSIYMPTANSEPHAWYSQDYAAFLEATDWGNALAALQQGGGPNTRADWLTGGRNALNAFDLGVVGGIGNVFGGLSLFDAADVDWLRFEIRGGNTSADANLGITVTTNEAAVLSATLYDATGTVEYGTLTDGRIPFDSLPNGIYSLKISSNAGVRDYGVTIDAPALTNSQGRSVGANDSERKAENWGVIAGTRLQSGLTLPPRPLSSPDGGWRYFEFSAPRLPGAFDWALTLSTPDGVAVEGELFRKRNDLLEAMGATSDATGPTLSYHSFGESETFVLRVRQSAVNASPAAFRAQFERGSSQELISPVERTGTHRLGRNAAGKAFSNTTQIQYGDNPLPMRFNDRWDIIDAEVVDGKNFVFAQAGSNGPRYRMLADAEWRIAGMESIGNANSLAIRRPTMRVDSEQRVFAEDIPVLFADGSSILREPEAGWQAVAVEPVPMGDTDLIPPDNRMLLRSLANEDLFRIWSFGDDWRFDREIASNDLPDAGQLEHDFLVDLNGNKEIGA